MTSKKGSASTRKPLSKSTVKTPKRASASTRRQSPNVTMKTPKRMLLELLKLNVVGKMHHKPVVRMAHANMRNKVKSPKPGHDWGNQDTATNSIGCCTGPGCGGA
jgi:hypothetical protein